MSSSLKDGYVRLNSTESNSTGGALQRKNDFTDTEQPSPEDVAKRAAAVAKAAARKERRAKFMRMSRSLESHLSSSNILWFQAS